MGMLVAIACSTSFLTPVSHPVNVLMLGPAGYTFGDFFRVGFGLTLVTLAATLAAMLLFWGIPLT
jgi:di/tricarboxylate transporter